jgi:hypothetical protein
MRLFIYPSDIEIIVGCSKQHAEKLHRDIREALGKIIRDKDKKILKKQPLTINEYCSYNGIKKEEVISVLKLV